MQIRISHSDLDPYHEVQQYQATQTHLQGKYGATTVFVGTMRDLNQDDKVLHMQLEHYPGMTEQYLHSIAQQAIDKWGLFDVLIVHRVGEINPDDPIVVVAVWSAHRAAAYEANRFIMEELKSHAPFWKKETLANNQTRWVEKNTPGQ
jgi:molybdopterin synthase catalytic subunit